MSTPEPSDIGLLWLLTKGWSLCKVQSPSMTTLKLPCTPLGLSHRVATDAGSPQFSRGGEHEQEDTGTGPARVQPLCLQGFNLPAAEGQHC